MATRSNLFRRLPAALLALLLCAVLSALAAPRAAHADAAPHFVGSALRAAPEPHPSALLAPRAPKVHVAPAAPAERLPPFAAWSSSHFRALICEQVGRARTLGPGVVLGHFHGQRRIPRMNSDEPPRR
jgi:hypothetical protein